MLSAVHLQRRTADERIDTSRAYFEWAEPRAYHAWWFNGTD